jgi:hypothetical protein
MRAYLGRIRQCRLMSRAVVSLILVVLWPSIGAAIQLLPGETSGEFSFGVVNNVILFGGGGLSTPAGDSIGFGFDRPGGFGPTGAGLTWSQAFTAHASVTHAGQFFSRAAASLANHAPSCLTSPPPCTLTHRRR